MPKSRNRRKNGKKKDGTYKKLDTKSRIRIYTSYHKKLAEYEAMTLEELEELGRTTRLGGGYRLAYVQILTKKRVKKTNGN